MRGAPLKDKKAASVEDSVQLVTFHVGGEEYGLDITSISEVIRLLKITPLPHMPEFVEGVVNLRGVLIPVVDLRKRFALSLTTQNLKKMRMLITKGAVPGSAGEGGLLGLVVDGVNEVIQIPRTDIGRAPEAALGRHADFITGMGKLGDRLIILVDITKILSQQERSALAEAAHVGP